MVFLILSPSYLRIIYSIIASSCIRFEKHPQYHQGIYYSHQNILKTLNRKNEIGNS